jgi:hypothetical protein
VITQLHSFTFFSNYILIFQPNQFTGKKKVKENCSQFSDTHGVCACMRVCLGFEFVLHSFSIEKMHNNVLYTTFFFATTAASSSSSLFLLFTYTTIKLKLCNSVEKCST